MPVIAVPTITIEAMPTGRLRNPSAGQHGCVLWPRRRGPTKRTGVAVRKPKNNAPKGALTKRTQHKTKRGDSSGRTSRNKKSVKATAAKGPAKKAKAAKKFERVRKGRFRYWEI